MKLKKDDNLRKMAARTGWSCETLGKKIINRLKELDIDLDLYYGCTIDEAIKDIDHTPLTVMIYTIGKANSYWIPFFKDLVIMGEGDCPDCGGELRFKDYGERGRFSGDGYNYPIEWDGEVEMKCYECNKIFTV